MVKEMLASSSNSTEDRLRNIVASTAAVMFLGTPHRGSAELAKLGDWARSMISAFRVKTNPAILDALRLKTNDLARAQESFSVAWSRYNFRVKTFQEGLGLTGLNFGPFGKKVVPDFSSLIGDVRERAETIQANHMEMCRFTGLDDPNYGRICGEVTSVYNWLAEFNTTTAHDVDSQSFTAKTLAIPPHDNSAREMSERERTCLQSLLFPNMNQRTQNLECPAEGTCSWFFEHGAFVDWLTHENQDQFRGLLWLRGKPGSGKSTLLKEAFLRATMEVSGSECHVASFFFNAKGDDLEHSPFGMLRSIIHQMCSQSPNLLGALMNFAQSRRVLSGEQMASWNEAELRAFLISGIVGHRKRVIIFIDAIDECDSSSIRDVADFWREITMTAYRAGVQLSVCLSSRHFPAISVNDCPVIIVEDYNHTDIVKFVRRRLAYGMSDKHASQQIIEGKILEKSGGIFLWVSLVVKDILRKYDEGQGLRLLLKHLDAVPRELGDLFCQLLTAGPFSTMVLRMFQWALLPAKPLRLHEWHHILAFIGDTAPSSLHQWRQSDAYTDTDEQLEKRITHLSRGLLGFNVRNSISHEPADESMSARAGAGSLDLDTGETRVVQVIHESVREYFLDGPGFAVLNPNFAKESLAHAHLSMMNVCLDYILIDELDALVGARFQAQRHTNHRLMPNETLPRPNRSASVASFGSASSHDGRQTSVELGKHRKETQRQDTLSASCERSHMNGSSSLMSPSTRMQDDLVVPHNLEQLSRSAGADEATSRWLRDQSTTDQAYCDATAASPSPRASITGGSQILGDHPALLSYTTFELFTHAQKADEHNTDPCQIIWRFLNNNIWRRWKALQEDLDEQTELLYFAADLGLSSWLNAKDVWDTSGIKASMEFAIAKNNAEVISRLSDAFPSMGHSNVTRSMIIASLASAPNADLLQAYLSRHWSRRHSSRGSAKAIEDTLSSKDQDGRTALHLAVIHQNATGVSVLLKNGADVSVVDPMLSTPLHLACMNQSRWTSMSWSNASNGVEVLTPRKEIVELLLNHHAQVDALDVHGRTPLFVACSNIALPPRQGTGGRFPDCEARFGRRNPSIVGLLLEHGANVNIRNSMELLPLHEACKNSSKGQSMVSIVSKLLDYGSPVNAVGGGRTPLHIAYFHEDYRLVGELLHRGADGLSRDHQGRSPRAPPHRLRSVH